MVGKLFWHEFAIELRKAKDSFSQLSTWSQECEFFDMHFDYANAIHVVGNC